MSNGRFGLCDKHYKLLGSILAASIAFILEVYGVFVLEIVRKITIRETDCGQNGQPQNNKLTKVNHQFKEYSDLLISM